MTANPRQRNHVNPGMDTTVNPIVIDDSFRSKTPAQPPHQLWSFKEEICNGEKFYPLFRIDQQWGYANERTFTELMVRALNRDEQSHTSASQQRIDAAIKELEKKQAAGITGIPIKLAIALLQEGRK